MIETALPPRLFANQTKYQLVIRLAALIIFTFGYGVIIMLIIAYSESEIYHEHLTALECVGPCILWLTLSITVSLWFGIKHKIVFDSNYSYNCDYSSILANRYLHLLHKNEPKTTSILGFLVALQAYLGTSQRTMTLTFKYSKIILVLSILSALVYAFIPTMLRIYYNNFWHFIDAISNHPMIGSCWIFAFITNFGISLILIRISYKITVDTFRWLLVWFSSILYILHSNKSKQKKLAYLSFDKM